ncbi:MAG: glycosyltransferase, partial [Planctomycetota bacterium]|nr:glycosyltransferase [Planctomycetota bacterium]
MKVLHVIPAVAARYGGPSGVVVHMARALQAKGVEVLIATTDADGPGGRLDVPSGVETEWAGAPTIFFPRRGGEAAKLSPALGRWLLGEVRRYDLVHVHAVFSFACAAAAAAALARRRPYVVRPLGTLAPWSLEQKPLRKRLALAAGGRRLLARAAAVHYTTEAERRSTEAALGTRNGVVVPLGVDPALLGPRPPSTTQARPYVLALGRLHPKKRLPALVEAFARARERLPAGARLVLAG